MLSRFQQKRTSKEEGFTLVEILIVILIILVLTSIALPVFANVQRGAIETQIKSDLRARVVAVQTLFTSEPRAVDTTAAGTATANNRIVTEFNKQPVPSITGATIVRSISKSPVSVSSANSTLLTLNGGNLAFPSWDNWAAIEYDSTAATRATSRNFAYSFDSSTGEYISWRGNAAGILSEAKN